MDADSKPWLSFLTLFGFEINAAIEQGCTAITFSEVYRGLESGSLLVDLANRYPNQFDFSFFPAGSDKERAIIAALRSAAPGLEGRERKKVGVHASGMSLIMAMVLEAVQKKQWTDPS